MTKKFKRGFVLGAIICLVGCGTPQFETVTVHDSPNQFVKLYHVPVQETGQRFNHPTVLSNEEMQAVLKGIMIQEFHGSSPLPFMKNIMKGSRHRAFSDAWIKYFAPKFIKGLQQATPEEVVTFFETGQVTSLQQATTSGGLFVREDELHIFLSNYHVLTEVAQDNEDYLAPFRLRPLDPIHPEPGQLEFDPPEFMVILNGSDFNEFLGRQSLHVAVQFRKISHASTPKSLSENP